MPGPLSTLLAAASQESVDRVGVGGPGAQGSAVLEPEPRHAGAAGTRTQTTSCGVLGPAPGPPGRKLRLRELVIILAFRDCCADQSNNTSENIIDGGEKEIQQFLWVS